MGLCVMSWQSRLGGYEIGLGLEQWCACLWVEYQRGFCDRCLFVAADAVVLVAWLCCHPLLTERVVVMGALRRPILLVLLGIFSLLPRRILLEP